MKLNLFEFGLHQLPFRGEKLQAGQLVRLLPPQLLHRERTPSSAPPSTSPLSTPINITGPFSTRSNFYYSHVAFPSWSRLTDCPPHLHPNMGFRRMRHRYAATLGHSILYSGRRLLAFMTTGHLLDAGATGRSLEQTSPYDYIAALWIVQSACSREGFTIP